MKAIFTIPLVHHKYLIKLLFPAILIATIINVSPRTVAYAEAVCFARIQSDARALRVIHHKHCAKFAAQTRIILLRTSCKP